jgi:hypothetical protein
MFQAVNFLTRCTEAPRCFSIFVSLHVTNVESLSWYPWYFEMFCYLPTFSSLVGIWQVTGHFACKIYLHLCSHLKRHLRVSRFLLERVILWADASERIKHTGHGRRTVVIFQKKEWKCSKTQQFFFSVAQQPGSGLSLLIVEVARSNGFRHTHTHTHTL